MLTTRSAVTEHIITQLLLADRHPEHHWHWPVLCTQSAGRIVVLRHFDADRKRLRFYTDRRSAKVSELAASPLAELVFYAADTRQQLRARGPVGEQPDETLRRRIWENLPLASRSNYATDLPPSTVIPRPVSTVDSLHDSEQDWTEQGAAFKNFTVLELAVERFDFLQLAAGRPLRCRWVSQFNPEDFYWLTP